MRCIGDLDDGHVIVFNNLAVSWSRLGQYPDLEQLLNRTRQGDVLVSFFTLGIL